ncbi:MAG TPA: hypothetical protein VEN29_10665 [Casimicrobiaceae bacterium]|nr:hypothetical protein [Casimicrobiaceae bacterium]
MRASSLEQDFSIVIGGPLFQALRRAHLTGDALELVRRRIVAITIIVWVPLFALSAADGKAWGDAVAVPFLYDIDAHARFLVALPLLIVAELVVHRRMRAIVAQFVTLDLVRGSVRERFDAAIASAMRLRNSVVVELTLIVLVYTVGILVVWRHYAALAAPTWYATPEEHGLRMQLAGWWYLIVSLPLFQFLLVRWYFRLIVWARFLWQVSRMDIAYAPMHPDRSGGVGFLSRIGYAFAPLLFAQGTLLAGMIANHIFFEGAVLTSFLLEVFTFVVIVVGFVLAPLLVFIAPLSRTKRAGLGDYGHLAKRYVDEFDAKWLRRAPSGGEPLVGSADIQSLADMANSFEVVNTMRLVPIKLETVVQLVVMTLLPVAPLLLTMISFEELLGQLVKTIL